MIKAIFTPQNRMSYLELSFDVMSFMQQLRRASGKQDFQVVPNTVSIAREDACEARVITEACSPYRITFASQVRINQSPLSPLAHLCCLHNIPTFLCTLTRIDSVPPHWVCLISLTFLYLQPLPILNHRVGVTCLVTKWVKYWDRHVRCFKGRTQRWTE